MPFLFIGIPLVATVILNALFSWIDHRATLWAALSAALVQMGLAAHCLARCFTQGGEITSSFLGDFTVDAFGAAVLFIIGMVAAVTIVVAGETVHVSRFTFGSGVLLIMMGMNGVVMVRDIFSLYVFIEAVSVSSFLLIAINKKRNELEGAFKYYLMSALATTMMLLATALIFALVGDTSYEAIALFAASQSGDPNIMLRVVFLLLATALLVKSGAVPFHTWVPDAHSSAPSPVSVLLAGIVIKVSGVYALMRVYRDVLLNDPSLGRVFLILGFVSIITGALGAIGQSDIKRMLAFSSVSQIGYIIMGLATGSPLGFIGAIAHFFNHASFKSLLFVDAAAIAEQTGTRDMTKMGGLAKRMPFTGASSVIGLLSMSGIPPLSGFWSKLLIVLALWRVSVPLAVAVLCTSALSLTYFLILQKKVFFGKTAPAMETVEECSPRLRFVQVVLSAINLGTGILFPAVLVLLQGRGLI